MKKYKYVNIEEVKKDSWYIVKYNNDYHVLNKNNKYILVGKNELEYILVNGINLFLKSTTITKYRSKKALIQHFLNEPCYKHIFN